MFPISIRQNFVVCIKLNILLDSVKDNKFTQYSIKDGKNVIMVLHVAVYWNKITYKNSFNFSSRTGKCNLSFF